MSAFLQESPNLRRYPGEGMRISYPMTAVSGPSLCWGAGSAFEGDLSLAVFEQIYGKARTWKSLLLCPLFWMAPGCGNLGAIPIRRLAENELYPY
jgi:hypothetical protein